MLGCQPDPGNRQARSSLIRLRSCWRSATQSWPHGIRRRRCRRSTERQPAWRRGTNDRRANVSSPAWHMVGRWLGGRSANSAESVWKGGDNDASGQEAPLLAAGGEALYAFSTVGLFHRHESLDAAAGDRFRDVDVALRIDSERVTGFKLTHIVPRTRDDPAEAECAEHVAACLVDQPDIVVVGIGIDDDFLAGRTLAREIVDIGPAIHVT